MATSGALGTVTYRANVLLEEAASRAGIVPNVITGELIIRFLRLLNTTISDFVNWGIQLWTREQIILPTYEGVSQVPTPDGTSLILSANRRTYMRPSGTSVSSAGGTESYAFDGDFDTIFTQSASNGNVYTDFGSAIAVNGIGLLAGATATFNGVIEDSSDGTTWSTVYTLTDIALVDAEWQWIDFDNARSRRYRRLRATGGSTIALRELFWGNSPSEIPLGVYGLDEYNWLPNKFMLAQITQFYQQRNVQNPILYVWPLTSETSKYDHLVCWRQRYLYDVTALAQDIEVPQRWREALTAILAFKICNSFKEADKSKLQILKTLMDESFIIARGEERDLGAMTMMTDVSAYTRG